MKTINYLPKPNNELISKYYNKFENDPIYYDNELSLSDHLNPNINNSNKSDVKNAIVLLNFYYSTNIKGKERVDKIADYISNSNTNFNTRVKQGDLSLVNDIASCTDKKYISFASKYCSHINPEVYPIYDSQVIKMLYLYNKKYNFITTKKLTKNNKSKFDLLVKDYSEFVNIIHDFIRKFNLNCSLVELDKFLWQLGKEN